MAYEGLQDIVDEFFPQSWYGPENRANALKLAEAVARFVREKFYNPPRAVLRGQGCGGFGYKFPDHPVIPRCTSRFDDSEFVSKPYHYQGHTFGELHPPVKGMNHTAPAYRVCSRCGRSDNSLMDEADNGVMPRCIK